MEEKRSQAGGALLLLLLCSRPLCVRIRIRSCKKWSRVVVVAVVVVAPLLYVVVVVVVGANDVSMVNTQTEQRKLAEDSDEGVEQQQQ